MYEKLFAIHMSTKGVIPQIYYKLLQISKKKTGNPMENLAIDLNWYFIKECFKLINHQENHIQTTMKYQNTSTRMSKI